MHSMCTDVPLRTVYEKNLPCSSKIYERTFSKRLEHLLLRVSRARAVTLLGMESGEGERRTYAKVRGKNQRVVPFVALADINRIRVKTGRI